MSSSSESDSDESEAGAADDDTKSLSNRGLDDDEESGPTPTTGAYFQTQHEISEAEIIVPDIDAVGPQEVLEKVGEIMAVMERMVIVKGAPSGWANQGSERALDSDTLLVFEDRKVMGYVSMGPVLPMDLRRIVRSMKPLARLPNPSTKSSSTIPTLSNQKRCG